MKKSTGVSMAKQEKKWQAESDARTLAQAEAIKQDQKRLSAATKAIPRIVKQEQEYLNQQQERVSALKKINPAGKKK